MQTERENVGVRPGDEQAARGSFVAQRKEYAAPVLTRLGDLRTLTMGTTPGFQDSGSPTAFGRAV